MDDRRADIVALAGNVIVVDVGQDHAHVAKEAEAGDGEELLDAHDGFRG